MVQKKPNIQLFDFYINNTGSVSFIKRENVILKKEVGPKVLGDVSDILQPTSKTTVRLLSSDSTITESEQIANHTSNPDIRLAIDPNSSASEPLDVDDATIQSLLTGNNKDMAAIDSERQRLVDTAPKWIPNYELTYTKNKKIQVNLDLIFTWCTKQDLNLHGITTRPSSVRVYQFRHWCLSAYRCTMNYTLF